MKNLLSVIIGWLVLFVAVVPVSAHVVVKPGEVGVGTFQTFTVGVPNEKDNSTVAVNLIIPDGVKSVTPNVKAGWKIEVKKSGEGEDAAVKEIVWSAGSIPQGQRDEFLFSAQVPAEEKTLQWKAYQTYQNGDVVAWNEDPEEHAKEMKEMAEKGEEMDHSKSGPASLTKVVNDLNGSPTTDSSNHSMSDGAKSSANTSTMLSVVAVVLSVAAFGMQMFKK